MVKLKQRLARLERIIEVETAADADGVLIYMPWEDRSRALAAMRDALQHQPHDSIDARGMAIALLCWGEAVTVRELVLSLHGDGPGSDRIIVHKTALITLPHSERVKQIPALCKRLGWEPPDKGSRGGRSDEP